MRRDRGRRPLLIVKMPDAGAGDWTKQQFNSFKSYDAGARAEAESVSDRLAVAAGSGRWQNWGVAADEFQESPIAGTGAGDYLYFWQQDREIDLTVVNAHSVYLEMLGETGVIGLMLLLFRLGADRVRPLPPAPAPPAEARNVAVALSPPGLSASTPPGTGTGSSPPSSCRPSPSRPGPWEPWL